MAPAGAARVTFWLVLAGSVLSISAAPQSPNVISREWATYNMQRQNIRIASQVSLLMSSPGMHREPTHWEQQQQQ
jgi:hypothetical protein